MDKVSCQVFFSIIYLTLTIFSDTLIKMALRLFTIDQLQTPLNVKRIKDVYGLAELCNFLETNKEVGFDVETNVTSEYFTRKIRTIQIGTPEKQFLIDLLDFAGNEETLRNCQGDFGKNTDLCPSIKYVTDIIKVYLCSNKVLKVGVNLGFEYQCFSWSFGLKIWHLYSADIVERCIWAGAHTLKDYPFFSMEKMMGRYFNTQINKDLQESFDLSTPITPEQETYAVLDTVFPLSIKRKQSIIITKDKLEEICQIENDCIGSFIDLHLNGIKIDREKWSNRIAQNKSELKEAIIELDKYFIPYVGSKLNEPVTEEQVIQAEKEWKDSIGDIRKENRQKHAELRRQRKAYLDKLEECEGEALINYGSQKQVLEVLVIMPGLKTLTSTNDDVLKKFNRPVIKAIQKYRELDKLITTYGESWVTEWRIKLGSKVNKGEGWLWPHDGKLHAKFNQYEADTGRSSSSQPNDQNLPTIESIRSCFIADNEDEVVITSDMSGAELRILAELSGEPVWITSFNKGQDVHEVCAEMMYKTEWPTWGIDGCAFYKIKDNGEQAKVKCKCPIHKEKRDEAKVPNFLIPYGGNATKLSGEINKSVKESQEILDLHKKSFPTLWSYLERSGKQAASTKEARDMFGRRRRFNEVTWDQAKDRAKEFHETEHPTDKQILSSMKYLYYAIERQGKNHPIQSTNATIIKLAMGNGVSSKGMPFLWHTLPLLGARMVLMVHDELVIIAPKKNAERVAKLVGRAFAVAAAEKMKRIKMEFDFHIAACWQK